MIPEFVPFPKIPRLSRECIITEKIDGTNASIYISDDLQTVLAGSRSQWITPEKDNYGFARWVETNRDELLKLGPGTHFGEWWGAGIQRRYGVDSKRLSLFNTRRWTAPGAVLPACVGLVPVLYEGEFDIDAVDFQLLVLKAGGSKAAPGFTQPEGVVVFHIAAQVMFKKTIEKDAEHKGKQP